MTKWEYFYSNLYKKSNFFYGHHILDDLKEVPTFTEELRNVCVGKIEYNKCLNVLQSFQNKTPGNDGLTIDFMWLFGLWLGDL